MPDLNSSQIYTGFWVNWSYGRVLGSTITIEATSANVLVAFLAIIVSIGAASLWNLATFTFYLYRHRPVLSDGLFHQQQAILRAQPSPGDMMIDFLRLSYVWARNAPRALQRGLIPAVCAACFALTTLAAGVFSSYVVNASDIQVLVRSANCAALNVTTESTDIQETYASELIVAGTDYARLCYSDDCSSSQCHEFVQPRVRFNVSAAPCPFNASMCLGSGDPAVVMESGLISSNDVLGVNSRSQDQIFVRKRTTCAPITTDGYFTTVPGNATDHIATRAVLPGEQLLILQYGALTFTDQNFTTGYSSIESNVTETYITNIITGNPSGQAAFTTIPEISRDDALTVLFSIWNNIVTYNAPVEDPVFSAHKEITISCVDSQRCPASGSTTRFGADSVVGVIGCAEQFQFCVPASAASESQQCTNLTDTSNLLALDNDQVLPGVNEFQVATLKLILDLLSFVDIGIGFDSLQAGSTTHYGTQLIDLPSNQWAIEVERWESIFWACVQKHVTNFAIGPSSQDQPDLFYRPSAPGDKALCQSVKMTKSGGFANVSVFGLAFTLSIAGSIVVFEVTLLKGLRFANKSVKAQIPSLGRWFRLGVLQLQCAVYRAQGEGDWIDLDDEIPITRTPMALTDLAQGSPVLESQQLQWARSQPSSSAGTVAAHNSSTDPSLNAQSDTPSMRSTNAPGSHIASRPGTA